MKALFKDFKGNSKEEWLAKVEKDLKGKPLESLDWEWSKGDTFKPFYSEGDLGKNPRVGLTNTLKNNDWEIGATIKVLDFKSANKEALLCLSAGANAICFNIEMSFDLADLDVLLNDIQLEWISSHFMISIEMQDSFLRLFNQVVLQKKQDINQVHFSLAFLGGHSGQIADFIHHQNTFPEGKFSCFIEENEEDINQSLASILKKLNRHFIEVNHAGGSIVSLAKTTLLSLHFSQRYFINIAKVRALRMLWSLFLNAWEINDDLAVFIEIHIDQNVQNQDINSNKIIASTQALAAASAGVDRLFIHPSEPDSTFAQRIAINAQHLMKMESYMDQVGDVGAGSYYIETLSETIAEKAWDIFRGKTLD